MNRTLDGRILKFRCSVITNDIHGTECRLEISNK